MPRLALQDIPLRSSPGEAPDTKRCKIISTTETEERWVRTLHVALQSCDFHQLSPELLLRELRFWNEVGCGRSVGESFLDSESGGALTYPDSSDVGRRRFRFEHTAIG